MATLLPEGKQSFTTSTGIPLVGGKLYTYDAGTNNPRTTYSDAAGTVPNANPVILDARGEATIFWSGAYKVILRDSVDSLIWTVDNVVSADTYASSTDAALRADLANGVTAGKGTTLIGWLRALTSSVATTLKSWLGWQEINAFEFMTVVQIAAYQASNDTLDLAIPLQTFIDACASSAAAGGKLVGRLPPGGARIGTTLNVPSGVVLRGHGVNTALKGWGVPIFKITGDFAIIEDMSMFCYTNAGVADPRTIDGITTNGVLATKNNYARIKNLYMQGWNRAIDFQYMDGSVVDGVTTVNANVGIRYFGQCVNNSVMNCRLVVNGGVSSIQAIKNVADQGEGLMVTNSLLASGSNAFYSDGFLVAGFYNCICDLHTGYAFDVNTVVGLTIDCPWVYAAQRCVNFQALGAAQIVDAYIKIGLATVTGAGGVVVAIGANNNSVVIDSGVYYLTNAAGVIPFLLSGNNIVVGSVIARNATTNSDMQVNGNNIRISQEAYLPNGVQTVVSQLRTVASGAVTTLPNPTGAVVERISVSGNTNISTINDPATWVGKIVALEFQSNPTVIDGAGNLDLGANFVAVATSTLLLMSTGTRWYRVGGNIN